MAGRNDIRSHIIIGSISHLRSGKAFPDQTVQTILIVVQIFFCFLRSQKDIRGSDGLMGILSTGFGLIGSGAGIIVVPVSLMDKGSGGVQGVLRKAQRVGSHIGNKTRGSLAADSHAFVQLLCDGHSAAGRHAQPAGCLLLQRGSNERRCRASFLYTALLAFHQKRLTLDFGKDMVDFLFRMKFLLSAVGTIVTCSECCVRCAAIECSIQIPVFLRDKIADLLLPFHDHLGSDGLNTACGQSAADRLPEKRRYFIPHDTVQDATCLLSVHKIDIDITGFVDTVRNDLLRDLVKGNALRFLIFQIEKFLQMPGNSFPFAVRVCCKIYDIRVFRTLPEIRNHICSSLDRNIVRLKIVLYVHTQLALRQITQVSHGSDNLIFTSQITLYGFCFCW